MSHVTVLVGSQWGDEGKGKWVDVLSKDSDIIARFQGGNNAGHTLYINGEKVVLHQLPSGVFQPGKISSLLSGVVINPVQLVSEIDDIRKLTQLDKNNFWVSEKAHIISPYHIYLDKKFEASASSSIGTTQRGIGPTYSEKINRTGLRVSSYIDDKKRKAWKDAMLESSESFRQFYEMQQSEWDEFEAAASDISVFVTQAEKRIRDALKSKSLLLEGAQGTLLDINHGTFPYVTSSSTIAGGAVISLGIDPRKISKIYGIAKAYVTRVGKGPFPTELEDDIGKKLGSKGQEFGATTQRPRRCGWFDAVAMRYAAEVNGLDSIFLNKMDILTGFSELKIAHSYKHPRLGTITNFPADYDTLNECQPVYQSYEGWSKEIPREGNKTDLPEEAIRYIQGIEEHSGVKVSMVGSGPHRNDFLACQ